MMLPGREADIIIHTPAGGLAEVADYQWNTKQKHRWWCDSCGTPLFGGGSYVDPKTGQLVGYFVMNVVTLDQPQEVLDLKDWKILYFNGSENQWLDGPSETPFPGQCV
jgi:hypothetical protein